MTVKGCFGWADRDAPGAEYLRAVSRCNHAVNETAGGRRGFPLPFMCTTGPQRDSLIMELLINAHRSLCSGLAVVFLFERGQ